MNTADFESGEDSSVDETEYGHKAHIINKGSLNHDQIHKRRRREKELKEEKMAKEIVFIEFESYKELIPFLEMLFKLKPSLITSFSQDKFRIVIENYSGITLSDDSQPKKPPTDPKNVGQKVNLLY
jgi:hypothetical protein